MAGLILPLGLWQAYDTYLALLTSQVTISSFVVRAGILLFLAKLFTNFISKYHFYTRAQALGCGTVPVYPHKDPTGLGIDLLLQALPLLKSHTVSDWITARLRRHGHTHFHRSLGGSWVLLTDDPENVKACLSTRFDDWPIAGPRLLATEPVLGPNSVFTSNGEAWHRARSMIRPSFVRHQIADLQCFGKHIRNLIGRLPTDGSTFDMQRLMLAMTMDASTDFLLGYSTDMLTDEPLVEAHVFTKAFEDAANEAATYARLGKVLFYLPHKTLDRNVKTLRDFILRYLRKAVVEREKKMRSGADGERSYVFLDELLKEGASEEYLVDQILGVLIGGRDTTANAVTTIFWYLARHPDVVRKLRREILAVGVHDPTWEQLKEMRYLQNIIKEGNVPNPQLLGHGSWMLTAAALRLVPPITTNGREANKDTILPRGGGPDGKQPILVPKGQAVRWSLLSMQRRTDIYGPDAEEFRPERWEMDDLRPGYVLFPDTHTLSPS